VQTFDYAAGQEHVTTPVTYEQSPPVGGPHDGEWADCTGTVYDVQIRQENAVHSLEHGAGLDHLRPRVVTGDALQTLTDVASESGRMSPPTPAGLPDQPAVLEHQLKVDSADDPRIEQFADFLTYNQEFYPEPGASCENPQFISDPLTWGRGSRGAAPMTTDARPRRRPGAETGAP
jgi:hypothetical protein